MKVSQAEFLKQYDQASRLNQELNKTNDSQKGSETEGAKGTEFKELLDSYQSGEKAAQTQASYKHPGLQMDTVAMSRLLKETEDIQGSVHRLIRELIERQGLSEDQLKKGEDGENLSVDEIAQEEAKKLIGPGGPLSPEAVSDRIVNFSIAVFGGDTGKVDIIRGAIDRGFDEAERMLGSLADISKDTYGLIQEKLDDWVNGEYEPGEEEETTSATSPE
jgi:hypothetical protein